jgi:hypothetical protein
VAPGAERESSAQPSHAEALEVATSWPFGLGKMSYFAGRWAPGRALTVAIGALACLLAAWLLARPRAPDRLGAALLAIFALVLFAHARLLAADRAEPGQREPWWRLSQVAAGRMEADLPPGLAVIESREDRFAEAYRLLRAAALRRQGHLEQARALVADLGPYPFKRHLLEALSMQPGEQLLMAREGFFHQVRRPRPARSLTLGRRVDLGCEALRLDVVVEAATGPRTAGPLISLGRRGEQPLATVEIPGDGRIALRTSTAHEEAALGWSRPGSYRLQLDWAPLAGRVELSAIGPGGDRADLAVPALASGSGSGRLEVVIGPPRQAAPGRELPWRARFWDLRLTARNVCSVPQPGVGAVSETASAPPERR